MNSAGFGLYVHWPFCLAKCPYCDFNSHVTRQVDHERWRRALRRALEAEHARCNPGPLDSLFFGGGTPSLMAPQTVTMVIEAADRLWGFAPGAEISLEANPTSAEASRFAGFASAGVNRLSMGVQALNDPDLKALGRMHSAEEARAAFKLARGVFERVSFDLIYARQNQSRAAWRVELREALEMAVDHLSLYQLTIEAGTRFGDLYDRGRLRGLPDDDLAALMYEDTQEICAAAGAPAYEISNHARPGAQSRHNLIYWRYGDYIGVGPGAHGRRMIGGRKLASAAISSPEGWLRAIEAGESGYKEMDIPPQDQAEEYLMMALRLSEGADMARFEALGGAPLEERTAMLCKEGLLTRRNGRLVASLRGRLLLNAVLARLLG